MNLFLPVILRTRDRCIWTKRDSSGKHTHLWFRSLFLLARKYPSRLELFFLPCVSQVVEGKRESFRHHRLPGKNQHSVTGASPESSSGKCVRSLYCVLKHRLETRLTSRSVPCPFSPWWSARRSWARVWAGTERSLCVWLVETESSLSGWPRCDPAFWMNVSGVFFFFFVTSLINWRFFPPPCAHECI